MTAIAELPVVYNRSLLSFANMHISEPTWYAIFLDRTQARVDEIEKIIRLEVGEADVKPRIETLLSRLKANHPHSAIRYSLALQNLLEDMLKSLEEERKESKQRSQTRCNILKEEIMMKAWHPDRVERLLLAGYDVEDM